MGENNGKKKETTTTIFWAQGTIVLENPATLNP